MHRRAKHAVLQTCYPDYREPLFRDLSQDDCFSLAHGDSYFSEGLTFCASRQPWQRAARNCFILRRSFLWQSGVLRWALQADVLVAEFNPRILSTWLILLARLLMRRPTVLWGHLWGRGRGGGLSRLVRLIMLRMANGAICYTRAQAEELRRLRAAFPVCVASNSCIRHADCGVARRIEESPGCVLYVGRLIREKKVCLLLDRKSVV